MNGSSKIIPMKHDMPHIIGKLKEQLLQYVKEHKDFGFELKLMAKEWC